MGLKLGDPLGKIVGGVFGGSISVEYTGFGGLPRILGSLFECGEGRRVGMLMCVEGLYPLCMYLIDEYFFRRSTGLLPRTGGLV